MCNTIRRPEVAGSYGPTLSPKAAQHGYCRIIGWLHLRWQHHKGSSMSSVAQRFAAAYFYHLQLCTDTTEPVETGFDPAKICAIQDLYVPKTISVKNLMLNIQPTAIPTSFICHHC